MKTGRVSGCGAVFGNGRKAGKYKYTHMPQTYAWVPADAGGRVGHMEA